MQPRIQIGDKVRLKSFEEFSRARAKYFPNWAPYLLEEYEQMVAYRGTRFKVIGSHISLLNLRRALDLECISSRCCGETSLLENFLELDMRNY